MVNIAKAERKHERPCLIGSANIPTSARSNGNFSARVLSGLTYPDKEQTLEASAKLLSVLLPELEKNHWPDWKKINAERIQPRRRTLDD